ncbi:AraC family transcriptional regulator [Algiphilus sp.]|uniref:AraC family transcriptional regulator n=1 Tax=Algiphilus sp. TaxID=1872431 RepID=UPI001CA61B1A|nr:AraC family transcriptional regulator [Algiphilus acroporae]MCR9091805.1 AraC family transcriptional regulator [Pseudomonadota bacterium]
MSDTPVEDLLSTVLRAYNLRAGIYGHPAVCGDYQFGTAGDGNASFHLLGTGECWVHTRTEAPIHMRAGDLIVMPRDAWHVMRSNDQPPDTGAMRQPKEGDGGFTTMLCGHFDFDSGRHNPVLEALPDIILIRADAAGDRLRHLANLMMIEVETHDPGHAPVLDRLADTLFVMVVRHHIFFSDAEHRGLIAALADPRLRKALDAMHQRPGENWTLERLASEAAMSRSVFAQRFNEVVGATPIDYLTRWRMVQAERMLRDPRASVASVMEDVGYQTEAAFRKAFKRVHGYGPGRLRRMFRRGGRSDAA